jgi:hypothetical protein
MNKKEKIEELKRLIKTIKNNMHKPRINIRLPSNQKDFYRIEMEKYLDKED